MSTSRKRRRYLRWVRYDLRTSPVGSGERTHRGRTGAAEALDRATRAHYDSGGWNVRMRRSWPPRG
jgi:hypothetical protein